MLVVVAFPLYSCCTMFSMILHVDHNGQFEDCVCMFMLDLRFSFHCVDIIYLKELFFLVDILTSNIKEVILLYVKKRKVI
jgi:hypothetical protein